MQSMNDKPIHLVANDLIRDLETLNRVHFGPANIELIVEFLTAYRNSWIADIDKVEHDLAELELALYAYLRCGTKKHDELVAILRAGTHRD